MSRPRKQYSAEQKAKIALAAIKGQQTLNEIASDFGVHPTQVAQWKKHLLDEASKTFASARDRQAEETEALVARLYQEIGQLKVELDWLKKNLDVSTDAKRALVETAHPAMSVRRQCALLGIARSGLSYQPVAPSALTVAVLHALDMLYTAYPFYGSRRMTHELRTLGYPVNRKRVSRLMQELGLVAIYPGPRTTIPQPGHTVYPYLLREMAITAVNHVWSTDITYIRVRGGFVYLTAVIDWYSRYVLAWEVSNTLEGTCCLSTLARALRVATPQIFNTDQGSQYTSQEFTGRLRDAGVRISRDGRGRALDHIFVERLWRSVKYEEVYLKDYASMGDAVAGLGHYFRFYRFGH